MTLHTGVEIKLYHQVQAQEEVCMGTVLSEAVVMTPTGVNHTETITRQPVAKPRIERGADRTVPGIISTTRLKLTLSPGTPESPGLEKRTLYMKR